MQSFLERLVELFYEKELYTFDSDWRISKDKKKMYHARQKYRAKVMLLGEIAVFFLDKK